jgi:predicted metal-binding protein
MIMKIGIIRCQEIAISPSKVRCAGWNCFPAIRDKTKYMDEYDTIELVGFDTCGGCPGRNRTDKIVERGLKLKEKGAEVIHLSTCIVLFCPNKDMFKAVLEEKTGLPIKEKTHTFPKGDPRLGTAAPAGEAPAPAAAPKKRPTSRRRTPKKSK